MGEIEVIQSDPCEMTGSQIDGRHNPQGDQQGVGGCRNIHLGCTMCSRISRLVMWTGNWGRQMRNTGIQCVQEDCEESDCEDIPIDYRVIERKEENTTKAC